MEGEAKLLVGGKKAKVEKTGFYLTPTIFTEVSPRHRFFNEEIFGPVLSVTTISKKLLNQ